MFAHHDTDLQRSNWRAFELMAESTMAVLRNFGPDQRLATAMLVRLVMADLDEDRARSN